MMEISDYVTKRNKALESLNKEELEKLFTGAGIEVPENEEVFWAGVHKARMQVTSMSDRLKEESAAWLLANGYHEMMWW